MKELTSNANISRVLRKAAAMIDAKAGGIRKGFHEINFAENELRAIARTLDTQSERGSFYKRAKTRKVPFYPERTLSSDIAEDR